MTTHDPAGALVVRIEEALARLGCTTAVVRGGPASGDARTLPLEERLLIASAVPQRQSEFAAGRTLARDALIALGGPADAISRGAAREPIWPEGFTGSITHAAGICIVIAARTNDLASVGVDVERTESIETALWPTICTDAELERVLAAPEPSRGSMIAALFSAKEAAFKCQFPVTKRFVEFRDAVIDIDASGNYRVGDATRGGAAADVFGRIRGVVTAGELFVWAVSVIGGTRAR